MLKIIKAPLEGAKGAWPEDLWVYQTTARTPMGKTPFKLAFGIEVVIPIEVGLSSLKRTHYDENLNNEELKLALDCLSKIRDNVTQKMARYLQKMSKYHNQRVKLRRFNPGDMVLQKVSQDAKDPTKGKLSPNWEGPYKVIRYSGRGSYYLEDLDRNSLLRPWNVEHLKKCY